MNQSQFHGDKTGLGIKQSHPLHRTCFQIIADLMKCTGHESHKRSTGSLAHLDNVEALDFLLTGDLWTVVDNVPAPCLLPTFLLLVPDLVRLGSLPSKSELSVLSESTKLTLLDLLGISLSSSVLEYCKSEPAPRSLLLNMFTFFLGPYTEATLVCLCFPFPVYDFVLVDFLGDPSSLDVVML